MGRVTPEVSGHDENRVKPDAEGLAEAPRKPRTSRPAAERTQLPRIACFPAFRRCVVCRAARPWRPRHPRPSFSVRSCSRPGLPALACPGCRPPLGFTAHLLVAVALAMLGAAIGLAISLRFAVRKALPKRVRSLQIAFRACPAAEEVYKVRARDAHPDAPPRRPLVLTEALADPIFEPVAEPLTEEPVEPEAPCCAASAALKAANRLPRGSSSSSPSGRMAVACARSICPRSIWTMRWSRTALEFSRNP
jgi:hypothetical protein